MSYNSHEFRLQAVILELLDGLGFSANMSADLAPKLVQVCQHHRARSSSPSSPTSAFAIIRDLAEVLAHEAGGGRAGAALAANLLAQYEHVKSQQISELDPFMNLIHALKEEPELVRMLAQTPSTEVVEHSRDVTETTYVASSHAGIPSSLSATATPGSTTRSAFGNMGSLGVGLLNRSMKGASSRDNLASSSILSSHRRSTSSTSLEKGIDGKYIQVSHPSESELDTFKLAEFKIEKTLDTSLAELTHRIIKASSHYRRISHFIEIHSAFDYGMVSHALAAAMRNVIKILRRWINYGEIWDPCDEFLIQERKLHLTKEQVAQEDFSDVYWDQRYVLRRDGIPPFLDGPLADRILRAGKYLNVIRECGIEVPEVSQRQSVQKTGKDSEGSTSKAAETETTKEPVRSDYLTHFLDIAYPELMKPRKQVSKDRLRSILELTIRNPSSTSLSLDPYKDDLTIELSPYPLVDQLIKVASMGTLGSAADVGSSAHSALASGSSNATNLFGKSCIDQSVFADFTKGIDAVMLGYKVTFPMSLVFNRKVITNLGRGVPAQTGRPMTAAPAGSRRINRVSSVGSLNAGDGPTSPDGFFSKMNSEGSGRASRSPSLTRPKGLGGAARRVRTRKSGSEGPASESDSVSGQGEADSGIDDDEELAAIPSDEREIEVFAGRMGAIRARMLHFIHQLQHFMCIDVIDPHWRRFEANMQKIISSVTSICMKFSSLSEAFSKYRAKRLFHLRIKLSGTSETSESSRGPGGMVGTFLDDEEDDVNGANREARTPIVSLSMFERDGVGKGSAAEVALSQIEAEQIQGTRLLLNALRFEGLAPAVQGVGGPGAGGTAGGGPSSACLFEFVTRLDYNDFYSKNFFSTVVLNNGLGSSSFLGGSAVTGDFGQAKA
ncbi:Gamma-tubulin complex component 2 [Phlyctochytrium bullatum]|nr:Gamma-tubulin complex component 2 [Phlyctochytrium bullatum]